MTRKELKIMYDIYKENRIGDKTLHEICTVAAKQRISQRKETFIDFVLFTFGIKSKVLRLQHHTNVFISIYTKVFDLSKNMPTSFKKFCEMDTSAYEKEYALAIGFVRLT